MSSLRVGCTDNGICRMRERLTWYEFHQGNCPPPLLHVQPNRCDHHYGQLDKLAMDTSVHTSVHTEEWRHKERRHHDELSLFHACKLAATLFGRSRTTGSRCFNLALVNNVAAFSAELFMRKSAHDRQHRQFRLTSSISPNVGS